MTPQLARLLLAGAFLGLVIGARAAETKPNVLFLFADDMRADSIAALDNKFVKTPNLDSLVQRGFVFNNAYCLGGNSAAVCTPSRNMLLSGKAFFRWKEFVPPGGKGGKGSIAPGDAPNWPLSMKDAGYLTYHQGKKGNTAPLIQAKFDHDLYINENLDRTCGEPGKMISDDTVKFLKERKDTRPFFMYLAFANPHDPRVAAGNYMNLYQRDQVPLPKNWLPMHPFDNGDMIIRDERLLPWPRTESDLRQTLHEYYAVITAMDAYMGRILQTLKELGQLDNTIVIFSADQGIAVGSHGLLGKQNLYDAGMKSPLIFAGPGIPKGRSDALIYLLDIYPTICDLVGGPIPAGIDGRSFKPVIAGQKKTVRSDLFLAYRHLQRAWRDGRWKIIRYPEVNVTQLFDLKNDPEEMKDLANDPAQAARVEQMMTKLKAAQQKFGDDLPLIVDNPKPAKWAPPSAEELKKMDQPKGGKKKKK
ncbi:MAG: sulfatase-like hydrolase/transferase [Verrucomicrobia bacterium]|nr:sulfatase-like hydrolase/transferase [Verrucomicrobiota bacterium]